MARKFLYIIAALIVLILAGLLALRLFGTQLSRIAFVPSETFKEQPALKPGIYDSDAMWIAKPGKANNPALWRPKGFNENAVTFDTAIFFIHPTSYLDRAHWNAPLDDAEANERAKIFVRGQASVFNASPIIWAPRYRQAAFGAFLTDKPEGKRALDAAYRDVLLAFDAFVKAQKPNTPIILAGHSQGSLHLVQLLKDRVAGKPIAKRIVAVYAVGWPISIDADLPALGLPACAGPDQTRCIMAWQSFAEPAETKDIVKAFEAAPSLTGKPRKDGKLVCTNPLTGGVAEDALATTNLGTLKNKADFSDGELIVGATPARCDDKGFLLIGDGPDLGPYVLPGKNYHVYDYSLFWANVREDVARRTRALAKK
jgi:Protein of unknown function (DUF3089)